jgi:hypothetical protein
MCEQREGECTSLIKEADAGKNVLDALLELTVWSGKSDVGGISGAAAAGQQRDGEATPLDDEGTRVAFAREGATPRLVVVGDDGEFARRELDVGGLVVAHKGRQVAHPTNSGARSPPILDHRHGGVALSVELLGAENLVQGSDAADAELAVLRVCIALTIGDIGEHVVQEGLLLELVACVIKAK